MPEVDLGNVMGPQGLPGSPGADGQDGRQGDQGEPGKDASINGVNALQIDVGTGLNASMNGNTYSISMEDEIHQAAQRAASGGALDQAIEQKAPAGFGLGAAYGGNIPNNDFNQAVANGVYSVGYSTYLNGPQGYTPNGGALIVISGRTDWIKHQYLFLGTSGMQGWILHRYYNDATATWSEWEFVNPPMLLGVEYRTTERYLGKPVYVKVVDCGLVVDSKTVDLGLSNPDIITDAVVILQRAPGPAFYTSAGIGDYGFSYFLNYYNATPRTGSIIFHVGNSLNSTPSQGYATIKYTKTTD